MRGHFRKVHRAHVTFRSAALRNLPYVTDLNHDGIPDIVMATYGGVAVLLGKGSGVLATPFYASHNLTTSLAIADFNGDGELDIVANIVTNGSQLIFLAGKGNGTFRPPQLLSNPCVDCSVAAADFDADGNMDLAVASTSSFFVLLGNGNGTFRSGPVAFPLGFGVWVTTGDINGDNLPDAVAVDFAGTVNVYIGKGDGTFKETQYTSKKSGFQAVLADLNHDGKPDLVTQDRDTDTISIWLNLGGGAFGSPATISAGCNAGFGCTFEGIAIGDFNEDGKLDIATPASVLLGNGDGSFGTPVPFLAGDEPITVASGDLNADGYSDLIVANFSATNISILFGSAQVLNQAPEIPVGLRPVSITSGDFNHDGKIDLAVASPAQLGVLLFAGNGDGTFTRKLSIPSLSPGAVISGDFNRDGKLDLAISSQSTGTTIFLGKADGSFTRGAQYPNLYGDCTNHAIGLTPAVCFATADVNGDGILDLVGANWIAPTFSVYLGKGDGTFVASQTMNLPASPTGLAVADLNHDGNPDLAFSLSFVGAVVYAGSRSGTFSNPVTLSDAGSTAAAVAIGDVTGDGNPDLVIAGGGGSGFNSYNVIVIPGNGNFTFAPAIYLLADASPLAVVLGDFNLDGHLDIASANYVGNNVSVFLGDGKGGFTSSPSYIAGSGACGLLAADINRDGKPDLVVVDQFSSSLTVLLHASF